MMGELITVQKFWKCWEGGTMKLANDRKYDYFCSWKAEGQDFYAYGILL